MQPYVYIFSRQIPLYGILFYFGIAAAAAVAAAISKKRELPVYEIAYSAVYVMIGAILGSKLLFVLVSWQDIIKYQLSFIEIIKGGFVFYGGLIGGALGLFIYTRQFSLKMVNFLDIYATVLPLGHAFGRIGCFFAGCCYGIEYDGVLSFTYSLSAGLTPLGVPLLPIQLIESVLLFVLFAVLIVLLSKLSANGIIFKIYLISYSVMRFVLEFFRGDAERGAFLMLSTSQWVSILIVLIFIWSDIREKYKHTKRNG